MNKSIFLFFLGFLFTCSGIISSAQGGLFGKLLNKTDAQSTRNSSSCFKRPPKEKSVESSSDEEESPKNESVSHQRNKRNAVSPTQIDENEKNRDPESNSSEEEEKKNFNESKHPPPTTEGSISFTASSSQEESDENCSTSNIGSSSGTIKDSLEGKKWKWDPKRDMYCCKKSSIQGTAQDGRFPLDQKTDLETEVFGLIYDTPPVPLYNPPKTSSLSKKNKKEIVSTPKEFPWDLHGCLMIEDKNIRAIGSGLLIKKKYVVTAAHCCFDRTTKSTATKISFYPGYSRKSKLTPTPPIRGKKIALYRQYRHKESDDDVLDMDLALIELEYPLETRQTYHLPKKSTGRALKKEDTINLTGCSADPPYNGQYLLSKEIAIKDIKNGRLEYATPTLNGQSGGGVWVVHNKRHCVVAIHTHGGKDGGSAVYLTAGKVKKIEKWIEIFEKLPENTQK